MTKKTKNVAFIGLCTALALVLSYIEAILPPLFAAVPGIKMGLANIMIIFVLYRRGPMEAFAVSVIRMLLVSLLFGNLMAFIYSLAGGMLSLIVMMLLRRAKLFSTVGVSVAGGVCHNVGQVLTAMLLLETSELGYYLVVLTVTGTLSGILIGLCGATLIKHIPNKV